MKKYLLGILFLLGAIVMVGCDKEIEKENNQISYDGYVKEIRDGEFDFVFDNNGTEDMMIVLSDDKVNEGEFLTVVTNGTVMLSEPARVNAIEIVRVDNNESVVLPCELFEIFDDEYIIVSDLEPTEGDMIFTYKVNYSDVEKLPEVEVGTKIFVEYDGRMTKSNPPIINATNIFVTEK